MAVPTVVTVIGNRPQYIKCAVVSHLLRQRVREVLVDTGQHYDHGLAGVFFEQLPLPSRTSRWASARARTPSRRRAA